MKLTTTKNSLNGKIKGLIYGFAGIGKTTLAGTLEKALFVSLEAGTGSIADKDIVMIDCTVGDDGNILSSEARLKKLEEAYKYLCTKDAINLYDTVFIDSLTEIADCIVEALSASKEYSDPSKALKMWGQYTKEMKAFVKSFRDLPHYNVFFTALVDDDKDELGNFVKGIAVPGKISRKIPQYLDEVFYLGTTKDKDGNDVRQLLTSGTSSITAKDRSGKLDQFEPADLGAIIKKINS